MGYENLGPGRMLAFVSPELDAGPILEVDGAPFREEVAHAGKDIGDHDMTRPHNPGLQVFEGWVEVSSGPEPDVSLIGEWRQLTHWETCRLRFFRPLFSDDHPEVTET